MPRMSLWLFAAFFIALLLATPAAAQPCGSHDSVLESLQRVYGEQVRFRALDSRGAVIEILLSTPDAQGWVTWSLVRTAPGGPTCFLVGGEAFEEVSASDPSGVEAGT